MLSRVGCCTCSRWDLYRRREYRWRYSRANELVMIVQKTGARNLPLLVFPVAIDVERAVQVTGRCCRVEKLLAVQFLAPVFDVPPAIRSRATTGYNQLETALHRELFAPFLQRPLTGKYVGTATGYSVTALFIVRYAIVRHQCVSSHGQVWKQQPESRGALHVFLIETIER